MLKKLIGQFAELKQNFRKEKPFKLKALSTELIEEAALTNDRLKALMATIAYSLYKLDSKTHIRKNPKWNVAKSQILVDLEKAMQRLEEKNFREFEKELGGIAESISRIDSEISNYATSVFQKAKTKLASTAYSYGLSLGQAAFLTGADKKNLLNYIGITKMHDEAGVSIGIAERLKTLKEVLAA